MRAGAEEMSRSVQGKWETWKRRGDKRTEDEMVKMRKSVSFLSGGVKTGNGPKKGKRGRETEGTSQKIKAKEKQQGLIEK